MRRRLADTREKDIHFETQLELSACAAIVTLKQQQLEEARRQHSSRKDRIPVLLCLRPGLHTSGI